MKKNLIFVLAMMFITLAVCSENFADACSVMMKTNSQGTFIGRTLEWWGPVQSRIAIIPRGFTDHDIGNNMSWTVKYGTIAIEDDQVYSYSGEGINEKGLTAHLLTQGDSIMPKLAANKPTLNSMS